MNVRLQNAIRDAGIMQVDLAERVGVTPQFLSQIIHGQKSPSAATIKRIADVLGVKMDDIYDVPR